MEWWNGKRGQKAQSVCLPGGGRVIRFDRRTYTYAAASTCRNRPEEDGDTVAVGLSMVID